MRNFMNFLRSFIAALAMVAFITIPVGIMMVAFAILGFDLTIDGQSFSKALLASGKIDITMVQPILNTAKIMFVGTLVGFVLSLYGVYAVWRLNRSRWELVQAEEIRAAMPMPPLSAPTPA